MIRFAAVAALAFAALAGAQPAAAQTPPSRNEFNSLINRLNGIEESLSQIRRQSGLPPAPTANAGGGEDAKSLERQEALRTELEAQIRDVTGAVERLTFELDKVARRLDKLVKDVDMRLADLEKASARGGEGAAAAANPSAAQPAPLQQAARPQPAMIEGTPEQQYQYAFGFVRQLDFDRAERSLKAFLDRHPTHDRAEEARYFLGETYFQRKNFQSAAETFLDTYKRHRDGRKAPDNLLKLGISLVNLGQKAEACTTFRELVTRFANNASAREARDLGVAEQKKNACGA